MDNRNYDLRVNASYEVPGIRPSDGVLRPSRIKAMLLYLIVGAGLLASSVVVSVVTMVFPDIDFWALQAIMTFTYYPLAFILPLAVLLKKGGRGSMTAMRPNPMRFRTVLLAVALALVSVYFSNYCLNLWALPFDALGFNIYAGSIPAPENVGQLMLAIIVVGVIPGLCEEAAFRGYIQPAFEEKGTKRAVIFVSLLFALLHGSCLGFPAQFVLGLIMALLMIFTDSIYPSIIFHTVYNSATMLQQYMQGQMNVTSPMPGEMFEFFGIGGVLLMLFMLVQTGAAIFFILRSLYCRAKNNGYKAIEKQPLRLRGGEIGMLIGGLSFSLIFFLIDLLTMAGVLV